MRIKKFDMNVFSVIALGIGSIVGAGIFALLGQVVLQAGERTYYSFLIAGVAALFSAYSYAKLAAKYPRSGGLTDYFRIAFKSRAISGTLTLIYLLTSAVSISMMAKSFGIYAVELLQNIWDINFNVNSFAIVLIVLTAIINMLGASDVGWTEIFLVGTKFSILLALIIAAIYNYPDTVTLTLEHTSNMDFMRSIGITFFAYAGYGVITNAAADVENPQRTITIGIFGTITIVMLLYMGLAFVVLNYIPARELDLDANTAVATAAHTLLGRGGYAFMYAAAAIAFTTGISATFFSIFRITRSLARQKILPALYMHKLWKHGTAGNFLSTGLIIVATLFFNFEAIVNIASAAYLVSYLAIFAANWVLRKDTVSSPSIIIIGMGLMGFILVIFLFSL